MTSVSRVSAALWEELVGERSARGACSVCRGREAVRLRRSAEPGDVAHPGSGGRGLRGRSHRAATRERAGPRGDKCEHTSGMLES